MFNLLSVVDGCVETNKKTIFCLLVLTLSYLPILAQAARGEQFYKADIPVESQSTQARKAAAATGLEQVLVRISGVENVFEYPEVQQAFGRAAEYVELYHYRDVAPEQGGGEALVFTYSAPLVERLLRNAQLPYWPTNRPKVLVWLALDDASEGKILVNDKQNPALASLAQAAQIRGLPLSYPLLDMDDQLAISAEQVWDMDEQALQQASERYHADTLLVGRLVQTSQGSWWTTWQFVHRDYSNLYDFRTEDVANLGRSAINPVADYLAQLYSVQQDGEQEPYLPVQVSNVEEFKDYRGVLNAFGRIALIRSADLVSIADTSMLFYLQISGNIEQLKNALDLDGSIQMIDPEAEQGPRILMPQYSINEPVPLYWKGR